jgi:hypothetical protein
MQTSHHTEDLTCFFFIFEENYFYLFVVVKYCSWIGVYLVSWCKLVAPRGGFLFAPVKTHFLQPISLWFYNNFFFSLFVLQERRSARTILGLYILFFFH